MPRFYTDLHTRAMCDSQGHMFVYNIGRRGRNIITFFDQVFEYGITANLPPPPRRPPQTPPPNHGNRT